MPLRLTLFYYDDIDVDAVPVATTVHHGMDSLQALTLLREATEGARAEWTGHEIVNELTGRRFQPDQLARIAYVRAHHGPEHRELFAEWVASELSERLWPWDDLITYLTPPESYWHHAACWVNTVFGAKVEDWLSRLLVERHHLNLPAAMYLHAQRRTCFGPRCPSHPAPPLSIRPNWGTRRR